MLTAQERRAMIDKIRAFPPRLEALVSGLSDQDLTTHYLPQEWTVAQNVHHLADSHMNAFVRVKLALTEDKPTIKPYDQDEWAKLPESTKADLQDSLMILAGLHSRWALLFDSLDESDWARQLMHPERGVITLEDILKTYANHCDAHVDQIQRTLAAKK